MRTALLFGTFAACALAADGALAASPARYDLRLSGTQSVTADGTATLAAPGTCSYSRKETGSATYRFRATIRLPVRAGRPTRSQASAGLAVTGAGNLDQTTAASAGCAEFPPIRESCASRANTARGITALARLTGRGRSGVGFAFVAGRPGDALFAGFGDECRLLAARAEFTSPRATLARPIALARAFRRPRGVVVGSEESIDFVNVFTGQVQDATCDECVPRRTTTRWTLVIQRVK